MNEGAGNELPRDQEQQRNLKQAYLSKEKKWQSHARVIRKITGARACMLFLPGSNIPYRDGPWPAGLTDAQLALALQQSSAHSEAFVFPCSRAENEDSLLIYPLNLEGEEPRLTLILHTLSEDAQIICNEAFSAYLEHLEIELEDISFPDAAKPDPSAHFRALIQNASDMIGLLDENAVYQYVSPSSEEQLGYHPRELLGRSAFEFLHEEEKAGLEEVLQQVLQGDQVEIPSFRFRDKKGDWRWIKTTLTNKLSDPAIRGIIANSRDITAEVNYLQALQRSESRLQKAGKIAGMGYWSLEMGKSRSLSWSDEVYAIWEVDQNLLTADFRYFMQTIHPDDREMLMLHQQSALRNNERIDLEHRIVMPDGRIKWVHELGQAVTNKQGQIIRLEGSVQDITKRVQQEQKSRLLERVLKNTTEAIVITKASPLDEPGPEIVYVNEAFCQLSGYPCEEIIGRSPRFLQGPKTAARDLRKLRKALENKESVNLELLNYRKNGEEFWMNLHIDPVFNETGELTHFIAVERDVSSQINKQLEKKIMADSGSIFNQNLDLIPCLEEVLAYLCRIGHFSMAELWMPSSVSQTFNLMAYCYRDSNSREFYDAFNGKSIPMEAESLPGEAFRTGKITTWEKQGGSMKFFRAHAARTAGLEGGMAIPLIHHEKVECVLLFAVRKNALELFRFQALFDSLKHFLGSEINRKKVETELGHLFRFVPDIIAVTNKEGDYVKINPAVRRILGYTPREIIGKNYLDFIYPEDIEKSLEAREKLARGQSNFSFENRLVSKSGKIVWLSWTSTPMPEEGLVYSVAKDITELKKLQKLLDSASHLSRLGGWEYTVPDQSLYWSPMICEIHGVEADYQPEISTAINFFREDYRPRVKRVLSQAVKKGKTWDEEWCLITAQGQEKWVRSMGQAEFVNNKCVRVYGSFQDIDVLKRIQLELEETNIRYQLATESSSMGIWDLNIRNKHLRWDRNMVKLYGEEDDVPLEGNLDAWLERLHPEDRIRMESGIRESLSVAKSHSIRFRIILPDGSIRYIKSFANIFRDAQGEPERMVGVNYDITEETLREMELQEAYERFEKVSQATNDAIWDWNIARDALYWGEGFRVLFGYNPDENVRVEDWEDLIHPADRHAVMESLQSAIAGNNIDIWQEEYRFRTFDGEYAYVLDRGRIIRNSEGRAVRMVGSLTDVSHQRAYAESLKKLNERLEIHARERNRYIKQLKESRQRYSELFQLSPQPMWVYDLDTLEFLDVNEAAQNLYGYSYEEFLQMTIVDIRPEDEVPVLMEALEKIRKKEKQYSRGEYWHRLKNGKIILVEIRSNIVQFEGRRAEVVLAVDITERMEHLRSIEAQNAKLREIAWTQSHVVRAPLARILGLIDFMQNDGNISEEERSMVLENVALSAVELDQIIREIISKSQPVEK